MWEGVPLIPAKELVIKFHALCAFAFVEVVHVELGRRMRYLADKRGHVGVLEVVWEQVFCEEAFIVNFEGGSFGVPGDDGQVAFLFQHFPCFLYKIGNGVFPHSSKKL